MGQLVPYDNKRVRECLEMICEGTTITTACKRANVLRRSIYAWRTKFPEFEDQVVKAQLMGADAIADQMLEIADDDASPPQYVKNKLDTLRWLLSKLYPAKYGERMSLEVSQQVSIREALEEAKARVAGRVIDVVPEKQLIDLLS